MVILYMNNIQIHKTKCKKPIHIINTIWADNVFTLLQTILAVEIRIANWNLFNTQTRWKLFNGLTTFSRHRECAVFCSESVWLLHRNTRNFKTFNTLKSVGTCYVTRNIKMLHGFYKFVKKIDDSVCIYKN